MDWEIGGRRFIRDVLEILPDIEIVAVTDTYVQESAPEEYTNIPYISPECIQKYEYDRNSREFLSRNYKRSSEQGC